MTHIPTLEPVTAAGRLRSLPAFLFAALASVLFAFPAGAQTTYSGSYSNVWGSDSGTFTPASPYNFAQFSFGGATNNGEVSGRLFTTDGSLAGTAQSLNVGQTFLINMGGQTGGGREGITTGGRVGFALYSGTDIYNGGSSNALGRVQSDSLLRVEFVGGNANTSIAGASTDAGSDFADFKNGEYYRVTVLSDRQFTISYGDTDATSDFTYNMSDLAGSGGTIQRLNVYNLGANMDALFGPIIVSNAPYLNFSNNTGESKTINGIVSNNGATANNVVKNGVGTVTFTGNNSYTGSTTISNGVLALNATSGAAAGSTASVAVGSGATLVISKDEQVANAASVTLSGGTIQRAAAASETFGDLTLTANSTLNFGSTGEDEFLKFGNLTLNGFTLGVSNFLLGNKLQYNAADFAAGQTLANTFSFTSSDARGFSFNSGVFTITAIPEPTTVAVALGLAALLLWPVRRRLIPSFSRES